MVELFLKEAVLMKDFRHAHVLGVVGIAFDNDSSPMVILPYMSNGDLRQYILNPQLVCIIYVYLIIVTFLASCSVLCSRSFS